MRLAKMLKDLRMNEGKLVAVKVPNSDGSCDELIGGICPSNDPAKINLIVEPGLYAGAKIIRNRIGLGILEVPTNMIKNYSLIYSEVQVYFNVGLMKW